MERTILIGTSVLAGNLGDGWRDNMEVAQAFAEYVELQLTQAFRAKYPDAHVSVQVDVQDAIGYAPEPILVIGNGDTEVDAQERLAENTLSVCWEQWVCSEDAEKYFS